MTRLLTLLASLLRAQSKSRSSDLRATAYRLVAADRAGRQERRAV